MSGAGNEIPSAPPTARQLRKSGLPARLHTPGGFRWESASADWEHVAEAVERFLTNPREDQPVETFKDGSRRKIFRLKPGFAQPLPSPAVVKAFPMHTLKHRLWRYRRYGPDEANHLLLARELHLPVPQVYALGFKRRLGLVSCTAVIMEDAAPRKSLREMLQMHAADQAAQSQCMNRAGRLLLKLHRAGCNHIDVNDEAIFLDDGGAESDMLIDFQYAYFLRKPSLRALVYQAAWLSHCCADRLPVGLLDDWARELFKSAEAGDVDDAWRLCNELRSQKLSRETRTRLS